jgi:ArsR family transcriptional regulator
LPNLTKPTSTDTTLTIVGARAQFDREYRAEYICLREYMKTASKPSIRVEMAFRALSDRTRLRILHLLGGGELCVCHLVDILGVPQPTASRHLAYLRRAGLVMARKEGLWMYYRLTPANNEFHAKLLDCLKSCSRDLPELARDARQLSVIQKCC